MRWVIRHAWLVSFFLAAVSAWLFSVTDDGTFVDCTDTCTVVRFTAQQRVQHTLIVAGIVFLVTRLILFLTKILRAAMASDPS